MKKILSTALCMLLFIGCSSPEKKAQKLVQSKLKETMNDPKSYESVKFSELDSTFTSLSDDSTFNALFNKAKFYLNRSESLMREADLLLSFENNYFERKKKLMDESGLYLDSAKMFRPLYEKAEKNFVPQHNGWAITHTFRGNNAMGAKILNTYLFTFNKKITEITDARSID